MRVAEISSSRSDLVESRQFLKKVRIDVEGSMGPYYWKQRIRTRIKERRDETMKLVVVVIPRDISVVLTFIMLCFRMVVLCLRPAVGSSGAGGGSGLGPEAGQLDE